jgi:AcrR family transcriptional regulator
MAVRRKKTKKDEAKPKKDRILDAAERLFARHGFHGVSVRDITRAAEVDVALANYHFGSKRELFAAVFERRAKLLNPERLEMLEEVQRAALPGTPTVEQIVAAFTQPLLERFARGGPGWKSYFALTVHLNSSPEWGSAFMSHFDPPVIKFVDMLRQALPGCEPREIFWGYHFLAAALSFTFADTGRIDRLSGGLCQSADLDSLQGRLMPFMAAGFHALASAAREP